jgi:hypothetical protein
VHTRAIDHAGIIHPLPETARRHWVNILELESTAESARPGT